MSNIVKLLMMALAWILLFLVSYKGCIEPEYCPDEPQEEAQVPATPVPANDYALVSSLGAGEVLTGTQWDAELQRLLTRYRNNPDQNIEVTGRYYDGETVPAGSDAADMGLYRAGQIADVLVAAGMDRDRIDLLSEKLSGAKPATDELFDAGDFAFATPVGADEPARPQLVEVDQDEIKIRFPFDKSTRDLGTEIETYLKTLAERIKISKETVDIVGHTDNVDTEAYNMRLGQQRADFVKQRLVSYGVAGSQIATSSKGENAPEASNATAEGRRKNRRAVLKLNRAQ